MNFEINDYLKFKDKIKYIVIEKEPENLIQENQLSDSSILKRSNSIKRIEQSYDYMLLGLDHALDNDLVMLSDNDEIPNLELINLKNLKNNFVIFEQFFLYYKFNLLYDRLKWFGTKACKKKR